MSYEYLSHLARLGEADIHPGKATASAAMLAALALADGLDVLELGCGTGGSLVRVARDAEVRVTGLDMLPEMLVQAHRRIATAGLGGRVTLVRGHTTALPFAAGSFDRVHCESVIAFHPDEVLLGTLREIHRVLRPGGRFVCNEAIWKPGVDDALAARINAGCLADFGLAQATEHAWHREDWVRELESAGFRVTSDALLGELGDCTPDLYGATVPSPGWRARLQQWHPAQVAGRWKYRRLLHRHRPLSMNVEARLFVTERQ